MRQVLVDIINQAFGVDPNERDEFTLELMRKSAKAKEDFASSCTPLAETKEWKELIDSNKSHVSNLMAEQAIRRSIRAEERALREEAAAIEREVREADFEQSLSAMHTSHRWAAKKLAANQELRSRARRVRLSA